MWIPHDNLGQGLISSLFGQISGLPSNILVRPYHFLAKLVFLKETFMMFLDLAVFHKH